MGEIQFLFGEATPVQNLHDSKPRINYVSQMNSFWKLVEGKSLLKPNSKLVYLALININNSCSWKDPFQATFGQVLSLTGIANHKTYYSCIDDLVQNGFIVWEKSHNQYQASTFSIFLLYQNSVEQVSSTPHASSMQVEEQASRMPHILKHINKKELNDMNESIDLFASDDVAKKKESIEEFLFEDFWKIYPNKVGRKVAEMKWKSLSNISKEKIKATIRAFINHKPFPAYNIPNPATYINQERWNDVLPLSTPTNPQSQNTRFGAKPAGAVDH